MHIQHCTYSDVSACEGHSRDLVTLLPPLSHACMAKIAKIGCKLNARSSCWCSHCQPKWFHWNVGNSIFLMSLGAVDVFPSAVWFLGNVCNNINNNMLGCKNVSNNIFRITPECKMLATASSGYARMPPKCFPRHSVSRWGGSNGLYESKVSQNKVD